MAEELTVDEIAHNYSVMADSVNLINGIIAGTERELYTTEEKKECVTRNVEHLQIMLSKAYWTTEDMTAVNSAVTAGQGYTA